MDMLKKIIVIIVLYTGIDGFSQSLDCSKFKNAKFYAPAFPTQYAVRKDSIQESYNDGKLEIIWKVKWLSDCKYEMECLKNMGEEQVKPGDKFIYTITEIEDDCFRTSIWYSNEKYPQGDTFERILCIKKD
ncbi:hypothetical protein [uncultured Flavobacterium sp.]|uniref:hypothetical protein n=1 Tax=uncultured Flavobacterium sp. TaxID=165435 RepID=UPI0025D13058|nr:hypothetical protein [uncultured Flavobacterium sp.]